MDHACPLVIVPRSAEVEGRTMLGFAFLGAMPEIKDVLASGQSILAIVLAGTEAVIDLGVDHAPILVIGDVEIQLIEGNGMKAVFLGHTLLLLKGWVSFLVGCKGIEPNATEGSPRTSSAPFDAI